MAQVKIYSSDYCPYCTRAKSLLTKRGVAQWEEIVVDGNSDVRAQMTQITGRPSVPQIFIGGIHVGGCDDLHALDAQGALLPMHQA